MIMQTKEQIDYNKKLEEQMAKEKEEINWSCPLHEEYAIGCSYCKSEAESRSID